MDESMKTERAPDTGARSVGRTGPQNQTLKRDAGYDHIKALLIYLMVLGHLLTRFGDGAAADGLYLLIFSFHMPAFLFVSGYFARCGPKRALSKLAPLYLVFQCVQFLTDALSAALSGGDWLAALYAFQLFTPRWTLWYLLALMAYHLLLPLLETDDRRKMARNLLLAVLLGLAVGCNPDTDNLLALSRICHFMPLFLLGYYEARCHLLRDLIARHRAACRAGTALLTAALTALLLCSGWPAAWFYGTESYGTAGFWWYTRLLVWAVALAWIFVLLVWTPRRPLPLLEKVGRNTLPVYLLHTLVLTALTEAGAGQWFPGNLLVLAALAALIAWALSRDVFARILGRIRVPCGQET